jgi:hypothetical protein
MSHKNTLSIQPGQPFLQEFTWNTDAGPILLEEASIAVRWWKDGKPAFSSTTECGEIDCSGPGEFTLHLDSQRAAMASQCDVYDAFAFLPEHGLTRITRGSVNTAPSPDQGA